MAIRVADSARNAALAPCALIGPEGSTQPPPIDPCNDAVESHEAIVVGAGSAGLAAVVALQERGCETTIIERAGSVGTSWRSRYGELRLKLLASNVEAPGPGDAPVVWPLPAPRRRHRLSGPVRPGPPRVDSLQYSAAQGRSRSRTVAIAPNLRADALQVPPDRDRLGCGARASPVARARDICARADPFIRVPHDASIIRRSQEDDPCPRFTTS